MKAEDYLKADQAVRQREQGLVVTAGLLAVAFIGLAAGLLVFLQDQWLTPLENSVRTRFNQGVANLVVAAALLPEMAAVALLAWCMILKPVQLLNRKYGMNCPHCGKSLTLHCRREFVLASGQCCLCFQDVLDPSERWRPKFRLISSSDAEDVPTDREPR